MGASGQGVGSGVWVHPALSFRESCPHAKAPGSPLLSESEELALKTLYSSFPPPLRCPLPSHHLPPFTTGRKSNPYMRGEKRLPTLHWEPVGGWISERLWIRVCCQLGSGLIFHILKGFFFLFSFFFSLPLNTPFYKISIGVWWGRFWEILF